MCYYVALYVDASDISFEKEFKNKPPTFDLFKSDFT